jgi:spermidine synthase
MNPWIHLDTAQIPGGGELKLMQRGQDFSIMSGTIELMNSRLSGSEVALANLAWAKIAERKAPRMLIGGLGMGFTLRAALADLPKDAQVTVAELVPAVIAWAKGPLAHLYNGALGDKRVILRQADVAHLLRDANPPYDAILMDVDNGPDGLNRDANDSLYSVAGLAVIRKAVRHGGVLAVWSAGPDQPFMGRMRRAGFAVEEVQVRASPSGKGARHIIWVGVAR